MVLATQLCDTFVLQFIFVSFFFTFFQVSPLLASVKNNVATYKDFYSIHLYAFKFVVKEPHMDVIVRCSHTFGHIVHTPNERFSNFSKVNKDFLLIIEPPWPPGYLNANSSDMKSFCPGAFFLVIFPYLVKQIFNHGKK